MVPQYGDNDFEVLIALNQRVESYTQRLQAFATNNGG